MKNIIGQEIRKIRLGAHESLFETAESLGVDRSHLNKIELGAYKPSSKVLDDIITHFSVEGIKASQLRDLLRRGVVEPVLIGAEERSEAMSSQIQAQPSGQVMIDAAKVQVLYTDSTFVNSSDYGLVLDVAQTVGGNNQQQVVVARIGMSIDHAKKLVEVINDHLQKFER